MRKEILKAIENFEQSNKDMDKLKKIFDTIEKDKDLLSKYNIKITIGSKAIF